MSGVARLTLIGSLALVALWPATSRADRSGGSHAVLSPSRLQLRKPSLALLAPSPLSSARPPTLWTLRPHREPTTRFIRTPLEAPRWTPLRAPSLVVPVPQLVPPSLTPGQSSDGALAFARGFRSVSEDDEAAEPPRFGLANIDYTVPPLLRYSSDDANVSVSIMPGGPCTAACLKVAGSF